MKTPKNIMTTIFCQLMEGLIQKCPKISDKELKSSISLSFKFLLKEKFQLLILLEDKEQKSEVKAP